LTTSLALLALGYLYFLLRACLGPWSSYLCLPCSWIIDCITIYTQLVVWDRGLANFLLRLTLNCNPPDLYFLTSWDYRSESLWLALCT
jgi:hypothetical protein